ncbi:prolyl oligopeptidase family serine peptidase [Ramlibacter albus]|uniref:S9 family peptidase n=1 Tax=Ramlibacter albus TaxID=2079448 RepID=A0A923M4X1_9BURK|nr:prolyl oligopeptidase family serine peptidase [Ramlibacter albus]MBC5763968.1 S9 family peptidase [Ramlibacter albus]
MHSFLKAAALGVLTLVAACTAPGPVAVATEDPYLWLEDVTGERQLAWVRERNAASQAVLEKRPEFAPLKARVREVLDSRERIPYPTRIGEHLYNFWTDAQNPRGVWRRTTLAEFRKPQPAWEVVLDVDALNRAEGASWVWKGFQCEPATAAGVVERCMVSLSRGGSDAKVQREFDLASKRFVDRGFVLPEAKNDIRWVSRDALYVETDFGPGTMSASGYPLQLRLWQRGTPLAQARIVYQSQPTDLGVNAEVTPTPGYVRHLVQRVVEFNTYENFLLRDGRLEKIDVPADTFLWFHREWLLLQLRSDYTAGGRTYRAGSLLAAGLDGFMKGERRLDVLFEPTATRFLVRRAVTFTQSRVLVESMDTVATRIEELWHEAGAWKRREFALPGKSSAYARSLHDRSLAADTLGESVLLTYEDFLTPDSLYLGRTGTNERELLKQLPKFFDAEGMRVERLFATSRDGTKVPYFVVWPKGATADGMNPTLLRGYGGFQNSELPHYAPATGNAWMARGGVYVVANIRGGGEFGPAWHRAALKGNRQRSFDDFIAVAEDLIARKITSPRHLGIYGGSNGGLLVGAVFTQRPELFNAVVCAVPLLDMKRYNKLLAGASWMAEYGDPDKPEDWAFLSAYSPYHHVAAGKKYPEVFFYTSTRDDRVHPAHARKMVARMQEQGHPVLYYENIEGGHGGAADAAQRAHLQALQFSYLWSKLARPYPAR